MVCAFTHASFLGGTFDKLDAALQDKRSALAPSSASGDIVFVAIDAASLKSIGTWPWSREVHADLLNQLTDEGARDIFFDIDFAFASDTEGDQALAAALERAGIVYLPVFLQSAGIDRAELDLNRPLPLFEERSWPTVVNVFSGEDGLVRTYPYGSVIGGAHIPSPAVHLSGLPVTSTQAFGINFAIDPTTVPVFSAADVLSGSVPQGTFAGRSVIIGASALELGDVFSVPVHGIIPGALIHAMAGETLAADVVPVLVPFLIPLSVLWLALFVLQGRQFRSPFRFLGATALFLVGQEALCFALFDIHAIVVPNAGIYPALFVFSLLSFAHRIVTGEWDTFRQKITAENANRLLGHFFEDSSDAIVILEAKGDVLLSSQSARRLFGTDAEGMPQIPKGLRDAAIDTISLRSQNKSGGVRSGEFFIGGACRHLEFIATPSTTIELTDGQTEARQIVSMTIRDVTQIKEQEREIAFLSNYDTLTGAMRREAFLSHLKLRLDRGHPCALFVLNLSRFKPINVLLGRAVGDRLLVELVQRLDNASLGLSPMARLGGDTFAIFTEDAATSERAKELANTIQIIASKPYVLGANRAIVGMHVGYVHHEDSTSIQPHELLLEAESVLDAARRSQATQPQLYDPIVARHQVRALLIEKEMEQALERQEFFLVHQPQHRVADNKLIGAEALVRWNSRSLGMVSPTEFIEIAESNGFIIELGAWILRKAIAEASSFPHDVSVAINVSSVQLANTDLSGELMSALSAFDVPAERICLELTETALAATPAHMAKKMDSLVASGASWALDDFGTGYSSLSLLTELPVAKLKFDRSFTTGLEKKSTTYALLKSVTEFCAELGIRSLCEGVETADQLGILADLGCDEVQGYCFAKPMSLQNFNLYCNRWEAQSEIEIPAQKWV